MKTTKVYYILQYQITDGPNKGMWVPLTYWDDYTYEEYRADNPKELLKRVAEDNYYDMEPYRSEFMGVIEKHYKLVEVHETIETLEIPLEDYRNILTVDKPVL